MIGSFCCCCCDVIFYKHIRLIPLSFRLSRLVEWLDNLNDKQKAYYDNNFENYYNWYLSQDSDFANYDIQNDVALDCKGGYASESFILGCSVDSSFIDTPLHYHWAEDIYYYFLNGSRVDFLTTIPYLLPVLDGDKIYSTVLNLSDLNDLDLDTLDFN